MNGEEKVVSRRKKKQNKQQHLFICLYFVEHEILLNF